MDFKTRRLDHWPWQWVRKYIPSEVHRVLLPVGNMEAHGIIPLGTDTLIPVALAENIADNVNALIAPAIPYGLTSSLRHYPGSMTMPAHVFEAYVYHILLDLVGTGFREIYILNGHGGQASELRNVARRVHHETRRCLAVMEWWELEVDIDSEHLVTPGGHGGTGETAMIQAIHEDWVHPEFLTPDEHAPLRRGVSAYPFPGSIMQLESETLEILDVTRAKGFFKAVASALENLILYLSSQWKRFETSQEA